MKKYAAYFYIVFVIVGLALLRPQVVAFSKHNKEISGLKSELIDLRSRELILQQQKELFDSKTKLWEKLNAVIPNSVDFQNYILTDLLRYWSEIGYSIESVTPKPSSEPHTMLVTVALTGDAADSYMVLEQIFKHPRAAKVENIQITSDKVPNHLVVSMKIYALDLTQLNDAKIDIEFLEREL